MLGVGDDSFPADPGSSAGLDSFFGTYTFGSAGAYYLAVSSCCNNPLALGTSTGGPTRPDGEFGGIARAGNSGPTSVNTTNGASAGTYTLHASLTAPVPLPGALWLLSAGMAGLAGITGLHRRRG